VVTERPPQDGHQLVDWRASTVAEKSPHVFDLGARRAKRLVLEYVHAGCQLDAPSVVGVSQVKGGQPGPVPDEDPAWVERTGDRPGFERCSGFGAVVKALSWSGISPLVRFEPSRPRESERS